MPSAADLDPLVGRADVLADVLATVEHSRLVTLVGPGGAGKTRLAAAVIDQRLGDGRDAWLVDASPLRETALLAPAIASAMGLGEGVTDDPLLAVITALGDGEALIVLDNLEQLDAGQLVAELVGAARGVRVLVTSRVPLAVRGEVEYVVPTLGLPVNDTPADVEESAAGQLFLARARAHGRFRDGLDASTAAAIAELLGRLDGLPLAIELAAARTRIMRPAEIVARLEREGSRAIDSSTGSGQSLASILDWTLSLLSPEQAAVIGAVAVFSGFDLEMAEALLPEHHVASALESLAALGLVRLDGEVEGSTRFRLLETVKAEAWHRHDAASANAVQARAIDVVAEVATRVLARIDAGDLDAIDRLEVEVDNVRMALDRLETTDPRRALGLWSVVAPLWQSGGRALEGMTRFERYSAAAPDPSPELAGAIVTYCSSVLGVRTEAANRALLVRALAIARAVGDRSSEVRGLSTLASSVVNGGDIAAAREVAAQLDEIEAAPDWPLEAPLDRMRFLEARHLIAAALHGLGSDASLDPLVAAVKAAKGQPVPPMARLGILGDLALVHLMREEIDACVAAANDATVLARGLHSHLLPWCLGTLAMAQAEAGLVDQAIDTLDEGIVLSLANASVVHVMDRLLASEAVSMAAGQPLLAARAYGAVLGMEATGVELPPDDRVLADRFVDRARASARQLDVELAIRDGASDDPLMLLGSIPAMLRAPAQVRSTRRTLQHGELTRREVEILALVGEGMSDPEIAERLFISPKTASVHVTRVKDKLGLDSRLEVALHARDLGLVRPAPKGD